MGMPRRGMLYALSCCLLLSTACASFEGQSQPTRQPQFTGTATFRPPGRAANGEEAEPPVIELALKVVGGTMPPGAELRVGRIWYGFDSFSSGLDPQPDVGGHGTELQPVVGKHEYARLDIAWSPKGVQDFWILIDAPLTNGHATHSHLGFFRVPNTGNGEVTIDLLEVR